MSKKKRRRRRLRINSRAKGKRGELLAAKEVVRVLGVLAETGRQRSGSEESPDIKHSIKGVHIEVKNTERLSLRKALKQAQDDCGRSIPTIMHKWNTGPWLFIHVFGDLPRLASLIHKRRHRITKQRRIRLKKRKKRVRL